MSSYFEYKPAANVIPTNSNPFWVVGVHPLGVRPHGGAAIVLGGVAAPRGRAAAACNV